MKVVISPYRNPFINLALEDYFLRANTQLPILFFYVNRPCVVLGRFQNPWLESNLPFLVDNDIWLVRRQSGGGCVFHDEGNLNFSFIVPESVIDKNKHASLIKDALAKADIDLMISPRHDLWLADKKGEWKKISGSAFKQTKSASFHHGTFLIHSDLSKLEKGLSTTFVPSTTKSIPSVRSKVITLWERHPGVHASDLIELVAHYLKALPVTLEGAILSDPLVQESFYHLRSEKWLMGETPFFEYKGVKVKKGLLSSGEDFSRASMQDYLSQEELDQFFPDFSEQRRLSNLIL